MTIKELCEKSGRCINCSFNPVCPCYCDYWDIPLNTLAKDDNDIITKAIIKTAKMLAPQKTGHWILTDDDFVYCSECEDSYYPRPIDVSWYYCPHCGAKMIDSQAKSEV